MNVDNGELLKRYNGEDGFTPIPQKLHDEAMRELGDKDRTTINLNGKSRLAKWAKQQRRKKIAKKSRRANRGSK